LVGQSRLLSAQIFNPWDTRPCLDSTGKEKHGEIEGEKEKEEEQEDTGERFLYLYKKKI
jgi:hypothetical protein